MMKEVSDTLMQGTSLFFMYRSDAGACRIGRLACRGEPFEWFAKLRVLAVFDVASSRRDVFQLMLVCW